ncbi:MAG: flagellar hook-length control protein FliK [Clostridiaceae bacterium]|jgi:flagellar hook-length control protein FliK|nr:flagellar hook-length control protein FliK [Clostridiaceae bacterium]
MESSILASLMVSGTAAPGRKGMVRKQEADDSFSGILAEKMQGSRNSGTNSANKADKAVGTGSRDRPGTRVRKDPDRDQSPDVSLKSAAPESRRDAGVKRNITSEADMSAHEAEKTDEAKKKELINEIILLLETLFAENYEALLGQNSFGEAGEETAEASDLHQLIQALPAALDRRLDRLQELLDRIGSMAKDNLAQDGFLALLDEVETLITKIQDSLTGRDAMGTIGVMKGGEDLESLISQLQSQCQEIAQRLRTMQDSETRVKFPEDSEKATDPIIDSAGQVQEAGKPESPASRRNSRADKETASVTDKTHGAAAERIGTPENAETREGYETAAHGQQAPGTGLSRTPDLRAEHTNYYLSDRQISQTVTSQVTMKIRLMAGEDKQELEMQLKPDSLGRLNLKIIHERGQVLARITAENEQVRSILENNMQLLKDALERNGYSVQSLEVSVGNQDNGSRQTRRREQGRRDRVEEPVAEKASVGARRLSPSGLYRLDIPGVSQQIDLIA